jgi:hypothetical protein
LFVQIALIRAGARNFQYAGIYDWGELSTENKILEMKGAVEFDGNKQSELSILNKVGFR